jgi:hypothetical protein
MLSSGFIKEGGKKRSSGKEGFLVLRVTSEYGQKKDISERL